MVVYPIVDMVLFPKWCTISSTNRSMCQKENTHFSSVLGDIFSFSERIFELCKLGDVSGQHVQTPFRIFRWSLFLPTYGDDLE